METTESAGRPAVGPADVHRIEFDVEWPPHHAAAYLVDGPEPVLIDAGKAGEHATDRLADGLADAGYAIADIEHVLITHCHSDHTGLTPVLREAGATIYAPAATLRELRRDTEAVRDGVRETARAVGLYDDQVERAVENAVDSHERERRFLPPDETSPLGRGESITLGGRSYRSLHTPGHEQHHVCFVVDVADGRALFSGDVLVEPFRPAALHAGLDRGAFEAVDAFLESTDRLAALDVDWAYPGHGPAFDTVDSVVETTRAKLEGLVADTRDALEACEPATPVVVTLERVGSFDHPAVLLDTVGALGTLERRGDATHDRSDGMRHYRLAA